MHADQATMFLQSLRGNQALVVLAYLAVQRAMTLEELEGLTGLHNDTVRTAVRGLAAKGFLHKQVGERGRQTWLPAGETFFGRLVGQNPKTSDSGSSSSSVVRVSLPLEEEQEEPPESENFGFCLRACDEVGIREPKRSQIARLDHVTPEFIRAHAKQAKDEGLAVGTAIYRIINNWDVVTPAQVSEEKAAAYCSRCWRVDCICSSADDYEPSGFKAVTLEDLREGGRRVQRVECSVCGYVGDGVGMKGVDYCIDHYNEYRKEILGFNRRKQ